MSPRQAHYVLSTHWDREWYQTFQNFRYQLVRLLDRVLEGWDNGQLKGPFQTDGQVIVLEDYLEIRPERRQKVGELLKEGKLVAGPWYVMPDEFIVSGESLVRNLLVGRQLVRTLGGNPSNAGFVCDIFGHNSQLPQIFAGFGIQGGYIWRGINPIQSTPSGVRKIQRLVRWRGADGTELPCYRFGKVGYCSYAVQVRHASEPDRPFDLEQTWEDMDAFLGEEAEATEVQPLLLFDGGDHMEWETQTYRVLSERVGRKDEPYDIVHTSLDAYLEAMLLEADKITTVVEGELREPALYPKDVDQQWLIAGVISSRVWIKQWNAVCQALLCQWAEPVTAMTRAVLGSEYPQGFLDVAWKWLLMNHPHDSICGCSIDAVHEDMRYRFHQCQDIAERLTMEATRQLAANVVGEVKQNEVRVVVFNPLLSQYQDVAELTLEIPVEWTTYSDWGYEARPAFRITTPDGEEVLFQGLDQDMNRTRFRVLGIKFPPSYKVHLVRVSLNLSIPALGYTTLIVRPTQNVQVNGSLVVTDRRSGKVYRDWLTFEDSGDIGDGWNYAAPCNDQAFVSSACQSSVALVHNGPLQATLRIRTPMNLPAEFDFNTRRRSERMTEVIIDSLVTLRAGSERVEVETTVHNTAGDHRLRVLFPSGAPAMTYLAETPFDVVERQIALRSDNHLYREPELETKPQQSWSAVYSAGRGMAVISSGLLESTVRDQPDRPLALTLFRSTRRTVMTEGETGGQLIGELNFRYWLAPLADEPDRAGLSRLGQLLAGGLRAVQQTTKDIALYRTDGKLPVEGSYLTVDGAVVVTSLRRVGAGLEVRLFNPNTSIVPASIHINPHLPVVIKPARAWLVDFESNIIQTLEGFDGQTVTLAVKPKQILTVRLE
jgi:alpha-mannosidase